ncbi:hypothetical protein KC315_g15354 [Hortaea werneckii]|nr:hypothetical protein KC315_g15354 [Hortaea werneckii]KAI7365654.1 hypothetical protein KC354_g4744 [Hortaea werneckii]KAI7538556.1 hypothetical protein KC331_g10283 [Hortaea werneckii]KAI7714041.1 hypothetical protein KC353_g7093 [Hortaea werneckii]
MSKSSAQQNDAQFPLLRLPIELRNMVYSAIDCTPITYRHLGEKTLCLEHHPLGNLRRVSRQLKDEYEKETLRHAKATIYLEAGNETNTLIFMTVAFAHVPLLGRVKHVDVRMDYETSMRIILIKQPSARFFCRNVARRFPDILTFDVNFHVYIPILEVFLINGFATLHDFFNMGLVPSSAQQKFCVNMLLRTYLWCPAELIDSEGKTIRPLMDFIRYHPSNTITYKGTLSDDGDGWYGMHLETWSAGSFDYEAILDEYEVSDEDPRRWYLA